MHARAAGCNYTACEDPMRWMRAIDGAAERRRRQEAGRARAHDVQELPRGDAVRHVVDQDPGAQGHRRMRRWQ